MTKRPARAISRGVSMSRRICREPTHVDTHRHPRPHVNVTRGRAPMRGARLSLTTSLGRVLALFDISPDLSR